MKKLMMAGTALLAGVCFAGVNYTVQTACHPDDVKSYETSKLRSRFVMEKVMVPDGRWGEASDITGACVFLCSPAADYVHGIVLPVDGGWLAR